MSKPNPTDPIRSQFRTPREYAILMAELFLKLASKNMRPFDWAVFSRVLGHIAVRQFEAGYKTQESVDEAIKVAGEIGDQTFRLAMVMTQNMKPPGPRSVATPLTQFEQDVDTTIVKPKKETLN